GAMLGRAEAHVMRLALVHALLDQSELIRADHLAAALALWDYAVASVRHVFGAAIGDALADQLLDFLKSRPEGVSRTEIRDCLGRHEKSENVLRSLATLEKYRLAWREQRKTAGGPVDTGFACG